MRTYRSRSYEELIEIWKGEQNVGTSMYSFSGVGKEDSEETHSLCLDQSVYTIVLYD